jgi:phosphoenolpyruvate carboxylase
MELVLSGASEALKIERDFKFLLDQYLEVLNGLPEEDFIRVIASKKWPHQLGMRSSQALGLYFSLLNLVEENAGAQNRRALETANQPSSEGMFRSVLKELQESRIPPQQILEALAHTNVEPVLTAHPTEAKRTTVLEHHRALYLCLVRLENQMWTPEERSYIVDEVRSIIEKIWKTGEIYYQKPEVQDEQKNVLHYLQKVFPIVIPEVFARLKQAWHWAGLAIPFPEDGDYLPQVHFGSWVGGDRDGHPLVQIEHTRNAFHQFREGARVLLHTSLVNLASSFSMNEEYAHPNSALLKRLHEMEQKIPRRGKPRETWRHFLNQMVMRLEPEGVIYKGSKDLLHDLKLLRGALMEVNCIRLVEIELDPIIQLVRAFPFTLARLDFRQNSDFQEIAFLQLLKACPGCKAQAFETASETERHNYLERELESSRPFTRPSQSITGEAKAILELYGVLKQEMSQHEGITIGSLITSMTRSASHLFMVHLMLREADIWRCGESGDWNPLQVVPLFETISDLENAPTILEQYLKNPFVMRSLEAQAKQNGLNMPRQQVMVGYSDSNKDGGVVASFVALHQAQKALVEVGQRLGVEIHFFHGRGGTISRGAGPTQRFLAALPAGALLGGMRLTEQGETISKKYANRITAIYHIESLLAGTLKGHFKKEAIEPLELDTLFKILYEAGFRKYRHLVDQEHFPRFFRDISPIDVLEHSRIGSRPARRTGIAGIADLRAIPWNFSWSQNRILLSGWFGFGSALQAVKTQNPKLWKWLIKSGLQQPILRYFIGNVATVLSATNFNIAKTYFGLSSQPKEHSELYDQIFNEHLLTMNLLQEITGKTLDEYCPVAFQALARRENGLNVLHTTQVQLLREWRAQGSPEDSPLLQDLLLNVNAISAGLGHTG